MLATFAWNHVLCRFEVSTTMGSILSIIMLIYGLIAGFCPSASYFRLSRLAKIKIWPAYVYLRLSLIAKCRSNLGYGAVRGYRSLILASSNLSMAVDGYSQSSHEL
jgi:hypothetical protein